MKAATIAGILSCFLSLHLNGCYSRTFVYVDPSLHEIDRQARIMEATGKLEGKTILLQNGSKAGILKFPRRTEMGFEGALQNPFLVHNDTGRDQYGARTITSKYLMPPPSERVELRIQNSDSLAALLFGKMDPDTAVKSVSIPWRSIEGVGTYKLSVLRSVSLATGSGLTAAFLLVWATTETGVKGDLDDAVYEGMK